jgi:hypothetical protein
MGTLTHASMLIPPFLVLLWVGLFSHLITLPKGYSRGIRSFSNDLDQDALASAPVELAVEDLLPRTEI